MSEPKDEAVERIAQLQYDLYRDVDGKYIKTHELWRADSDMQREMGLRAYKLLDLIKELGYRKLPAELPVLTDKDIFNALLKVAESRGFFSLQQISIVEQRRLSAAAQLAAIKKALDMPEKTDCNKVDYVTCSRCGKRVSNQTGTELVVRAWGECPECVQMPEKCCETCAIGGQVCPVPPIGTVLAKFFCSEWTKG